MKIDTTEKDHLEFRLDSKDLSELNITFEALDYSNIETRRVVWTLIDIARKELDADFDPTGRLLVEVFPDGRQGGCRLCITSLPQTRRSITIVATQTFTPHIFEFSSADDLIDMAKQIKKLPITSDDGELYKSNDKYRLIIPLSEKQEKLKAMLHEYVRFRGTDEVALSFTREHWSALIPEKALKAISLGS